MFSFVANRSSGGQPTLGISFLVFEGEGSTLLSHSGDRECVLP